MFTPITTQDQFNEMITPRIRRERKRMCTLMKEELQEIYASDNRADMQMQIVKLMQKLDNIQT